MNLYEQIKTHITPKLVTERYGPQIHRGDMICCPFHDDKTPSMKLYRTAYCFPSFFHTRTRGIMKLTGICTNDIIRSAWLIISALIRLRGGRNNR